MENENIISRMDAFCEAYKSIANPNDIAEMLKEYIKYLVGENVELVWYQSNIYTKIKSVDCACQVQSVAVVKNHLVFRLMETRCEDTCYYEFTERELRIDMLFKVIDCLLHTKNFIENPYTEEKDEYGEKDYFSTFVDKVKEKTRTQLTKRIFCWCVGDYNFY